MVLCGGSGERLWPLSRTARPKHLVNIGAHPSLLSQTLLRLHDLTGADGKVLALCNEADRFMVSEEARAVFGDHARILIEPERRDSGPAIAAGLAATLAEGRDPIVLISPADHLIGDLEAFRDNVASAARLAADGRIVTFGITPDRPHTGYGYLHIGDAIPGHDANDLVAFVEKPGLDRATEMLAEGGYLWNSGMFIARASVLAEAFEMHFPEGWAAARDAIDAIRPDLGMERLGAEAFAAAPKLSIDYAVMEKVSGLVVVPARFSWSDVGDWSAIAAMLDRDDNGNAVHGRAALVETSDSVIYSDTDTLVATLGMSDVVVATTADAVLVAPKRRTSDLKSVVAKLRDQGENEAGAHRRVDRPWGHYEPLAFGDRYQVKRITVKPGGILSLQSHKHRSEHWVVVRGTARVTLGDTVTDLGENESTYIPLGARHRLENPGEIDLELIEVQTGGYLGEDDIVRYEDVYGRAPYKAD